MRLLPFILGLLGGILAGALPAAIHVMLIAPAWYLAHDKAQDALLGALIGGLAAEFFSPWRFGAITVLALASVLATHVIITRILSVSGSLRLIVSLLVVTAIFSLPAAVLSQGYRLLPLSLLLTVVAGFALTVFYDARRRRLHS